MQRLQVEGAVVVMDVKVFFASIIAQADVVDSDAAAIHLCPWQHRQVGLPVTIVGRWNQLPPQENAGEDAPERNATLPPRPCEKPESKWNCREKDGAYWPQRRG